jgi:outer membrane protein TolC
MRFVAAAGLGLALVSTSASAQKAEDEQAAPAARSISLGELLEHAVRHSPELATARIDVTIAEARVLEAVGLEDWLLAMSGRYDRRRTESVAGNLVGTDELDRLAGNVSLSKLLFTGGTFSVEGDSTRSETLFAFGGGTRTTEVTTSLTGRLFQPLLRGRGRTVTRASRTRAQLARQAAVLQREGAARGLVRDLTGAYWELAYAAADLEIRVSSLDLARERRRLTNASVKAGATAPTELVAVDQVIASREEEIVVAELTLLQRALELRRLAGLEIGPGDLYLRAAAPLDVKPEEFDLDEVMAQALEASPEIAALEVQHKSARLEVEVTDNGLLPALDLSLYGGPLGTSNEFTESVSNMVNSGGYEAGGELRLQHNIGRNSARGASRRAVAERQRALVDLADMRLQIARAAAESVAQARAASRRLELSRTAIELSEKNIKAEVGRFELGKSTNFDVLLRQDELKQARLRYARAVTDYLRTRSFIAALTGDILRDHGISLDD